MSAPPAIIPVSKVPITVRPAVANDLQFIDRLQKMHSKMVGWMPTSALEGKIKLGHVLIAEENSSTDCADFTDLKNESVQSVQSVDHPRLGYCIGSDQYFKRDDVGIIYQMNVVPGKQRGLTGATLVKAMFERAAYGCKLFCCWCAQDIEANYFWESLGFIPLAFRAGSRGKDRVHIFWQRRIRADDETTPYWFPSQTSSGSIREDRLVFPIPPGVHWRDAMPRVLPGGAGGTGLQPVLDEKQEKHGLKTRATKKPTPKPVATLGRLSFAAPVPSKKKRSGGPAVGNSPKPPKKNDPKLVAAARELRDRWLERVNADPSVLLTEGKARGKYEVAKALTAPANEDARLLLPAA